MDLRPHIVVVEDEATQRQLLADYLSGQNFRVSAVDGGAALHRLVEREAPALVLLDVGLPGDDGFALVRWLRERSSRTGIIMVTSAADTVDRVVGLETGADDYIIKPFEPRELLARVRSVLRRGAPDRGAALGRRIAAILAADVAGYSRLVGDVLAEGDDILGDAVNIAARLEAIAEPGGVCLSAAAYEQVRGKLDIEVDDMGEQDLKNIARPLRAYRVVF